MPPCSRPLPPKGHSHHLLATKATWEAIKGALPAEARQFAEPTLFTAKPANA
jgi:hypothetical protein